MSLVPYTPKWDIEAATPSTISTRHTAASTIQRAVRGYQQARRAARGIKRAYNEISSAASTIKAAVGSGSRKGKPVARRLQYEDPAMYSRVRRYKLANVRKGGFIGRELKFKNDQYENTIGQTIASGRSDPIVSLCLHGIDQGDGEQQRDGRQYTIMSISLRGYVLFGNQDAAVVTSDHVRLVLVLDTQTNGAQLTATDVLDNFHGDNDLQTNSFRNLEYTKRFRVLKDMVVRKPVTGVGTSSTAGQVISNACTRYFKMNCNFKKGIKVLCTGTAGTIANMVDNSIHLIAVSVNSGNTLRYVSRCRFVG